MKKTHLSLILLLSLTGQFPANATTLTPVESLKTSGAREITPFKIQGTTYLAVPQLAQDVEGRPANMNGGDADVDVLIYKHQHGKFELYQSIPGHGNESAEFFSIGKDHYLATCSVNSGPKAPYNPQTYAKLYRWDGIKFYPIQQFFSYASKGWTHFTLQGKHFLALANGVVLPDSKEKNDTSSVIYQWDHKKFVPFQTFNTLWGYKFTKFDIGQSTFLGLTDHLKPSQIYQWNGKQFIPFQSFDKNGGRVFYHFKANDQDYLALANIAHPSKIYQWDGSQFKLLQTLSGAGGRNFLHFQAQGKNYLLRINFITGTRENPKAVQTSQIYELKDGQFVETDSITTYGGVSASKFHRQDKQYIAVANSLSEHIRFRVDSTIYQVD